MTQSSEIFEFLIKRTDWEMSNQPGWLYEIKHPILFLVIRVMKMNVEEWIVEVVTTGSKYRKHKYQWGRGSYWP